MRFVRGLETVNRTETMAARNCFSASLDGRGSMVVAMIKRLPAVVVVLALLASPLALYARGFTSDMPSCNGLCCLPQHHRASVPTEDLLTEKRSETTAEPECHHHSASTAKTKVSDAQDGAITTDASRHARSACAVHCAMHSKPHAMTFGLLAPIAPTKPSGLATIRIAADITGATSNSSAAARSGFFASPFQPPRA